MKWSFATAGLIIMGLFGLIIILLFHEITVSNEQDYYTLKDATEAAMLEAIDVAYYRLTGDIKMSQEKFVENFTRKFYESSTFGKGNYVIEFYQIIESPAKVSLRIVDATNSYNVYNINTSTNIVNELSAILDGNKAKTSEIEIEKTDEDTYTLIEYTCKALNSNRAWNRQPSYAGAPLQWCLENCGEMSNCVERNIGQLDGNGNLTFEGTYTCRSVCPENKELINGYCYNIEEEQTGSETNLTIQAVQPYYNRSRYEAGECNKHNIDKKRYFIY